MIFKSVFRTVFSKIMIKVVDRDAAVFNLETQDGFNLLQEDGSFIKI